MQPNKHTPEQALPKRVLSKPVLDIAIQAADMLIGAVILLTSILLC